MNSNSQTLVGYYLWVYLETTILLCFISYNCERMGYVCVGGGRVEASGVFTGAGFSALICDFCVFS